MKLKHWILLLTATTIFIGLFSFYQRVIYSAPKVIDSTSALPTPIHLSESHITLGNSWLKRNQQGNWECYIEGNGYQRGLVLGILQKELGEKQEAVFVKEINNQVANWFFRKLLIVGISWFNRDLDQNIPEEYRKELYGISKSFSNNFDYIGPKYNRIVNYHAAHDIGHAVQNMRMVGCTAVGAWKFDSTQTKMLIGRNFDFYFGDDFAKQKVVLISKPDSGYANISVTWPSFIGVVSGMNEKGLGITLNSIKSELPSNSGTPVSIIAREILQYASTIAEAEAIANNYTSFVSESFTISSVIDQKIAVIEKTPEQTGIYYSPNDTMVVTNHCQSEALKSLPINITHKQTSETVDRYKHTYSLIRRTDSLNATNLVELLRNTKGINNTDIGLGNPMAINQLLAHHTVLFNNVSKLVYVSSFPFQLGQFSVYDLNNVNQWSSNEVQFPITSDSLNIAASSFLQTNDYADFLTYKKLKTLLVNATNADKLLNPSQLESFLHSNTEMYETHMLLGNYFHSQNDTTKAISAYETALTKSIPYQEDSDFITNQIALLSK